MFKKLSFTAFCIISITLLCSFAHAKTTKVLINQFVSHPALDSAREGIQEALKERKLDIEVKVQNAQGNIASAAQIAKHQAAQYHDAIIVAIATPSAQSAAKAKSDKTILAFIAVTDPSAAGLLAVPNVIGVADAPPVAELIEIILKTLPDKKRVGIIFNPGEINSVKMTESFADISKTKGLIVITAPVNSSINVKTAVEKLISNIDLLFVPQDNTVVSAIDTLTKIAAEKKIPVIGNDPSLINNGLLLAFGCDYFKSGRQLGSMIADKIQDIKVGTAIQSCNIKELKINAKAAESLGLDPTIFKKVAL